MRETPAQREVRLEALALRLVQGAGVDQHLGEIAREEGGAARRRSHRPEGGARVLREAGRLKDTRGDLCAVCPEGRRRTLIVELCGEQDRPVRRVRAARDRLEGIGVETAPSEPERSIAEPVRKRVTPLPVASASRLASAIAYVEPGRATRKTVRPGT